MHELTPADLAQLASVGISPETAAEQLARLRTAPPPIHLVRPATVGDGIEQFTTTRHSEIAELIDRGDAAASAGRVLKFVPASGAATRMFKDLISALQGPRLPSDTPAAREFFSRLDEFPFAGELRQRTGLDRSPANDAEERALLRALLVDMELAALPKALVPFHRSDRVRTAFEEQLLEGTRYTRDAHGVSRLHFTVPDEARQRFETTLDKLRPLVEAQRRGARLSVAFSTQSPSTDTLALDETGAPFRNADGSLLLRPSGHGALLGNLQECGGDIVVVKNIDNILPDETSGEVVRWKRLLIGHLARLQAEVFSHLIAITTSSPSREALEAARQYAAARFARRLPPDAGRDQIVNALHRPLRVCGVVRNEGEPGGAPFWVRHADGHESLQIVEPAQVNLDDPEQARIFRGATHFNPVDLICGLRGYNGVAFDLAPFVDPDTAFVTVKTADGRRLTALERPGLWNGSMAGWNTTCVEVPGATFAPVKTVFDLLRPQHQHVPHVRPQSAATADVTGTVLIIDDQPMNQRLLSHILEKGGLRTMVAGDWDRGLALLQSHTIDLVLLDIVLPGLDGYEILTRLLADPGTFDIPVVLISSLDTVADKVRGMELGAADYVTKPFDPQEVLARVRAQLRIRHLAASLSRSNAQLVMREQLMLEELRAAAEVQKHLLPGVDLSHTRLISGSVFEPSLAIGGDIYNALELPGGATLVYMADVSGHGVASALLTMSLSQWLSSFAAMQTSADTLSPAAILQSLEVEYPFERFGKYFSIVIAVVNAATGEVRYSAAGHPPPVLVRTSGEVLRLEAGGPVIGMGFGLTFDEGTCHLASGDRLLFYTDGLTEDLDAEGVKFGQDHLGQYFVERSNIPLPDVCGSLGAMLRARRSDAPALDDIALLAFERR